MSIFGVRDPGSFRDPAGEVHRLGTRVIRTVHERAQPDIDALVNSGTLKRLEDDGLLIASAAVDRHAVRVDAPQSSRLIEHPCLPYISYPYEWCFSQLREAALLHLEIQERLLADGFSLSDSSAYNIQFDGASPLFIDLLSIRRYGQGEYWSGYRQFCEQFLNPLLLTSTRGVPFNAWYRGSIEGISTVDTAAILPAPTMLSWLKLLHVHLPAFVERRLRRSASPSAASSRSLSEAAYRGLLRQMRRLITSLALRTTAASTWSDYSEANTYSTDETARKISAVRSFVESWRPVNLWDLGCNTGLFAEAALSSGCKFVVGFDADPIAVERAYTRARSRDLRFLPLVVDLANPSPGQGWEGAERQSLASRGSPNAIVALALLHHLVITRNIPMERAIRWLVAFAPRGMIEFVPKSDPMVQQMLKTRQDIFPDYNRESFVKLVARYAKIDRTEVVSACGRELFTFSRMQ